MSKNEISYYSTVGRRKTAIARVKMALGKGKVELNNKNLKDYFYTKEQINSSQNPLMVANCINKYDITAKLNGGGLSGQADALSLGIARALIKAEPDLRPTLKKAGLLTRDSRKKERKKYGQPGARKKFQFSKR